MVPSPKRSRAPTPTNVDSAPDNDDISVTEDQVAREPPLLILHPPASRLCFSLDPTTGAQPLRSDLVVLPANPGLRSSIEMRLDKKSGMVKQTWKAPGKELLDEVRLLAAALNEACCDAGTGAFVVRDGDNKGGGTMLYLPLEWQLVEKREFIEQSPYQRYMSTHRVPLKNQALRLCGMGATMAGPMPTIIHVLSPQFGTLSAAPPAPSITHHSADVHLLVLNEQYYVLSAQHMSALSSGRKTWKVGNVMLAASNQSRKGLAGVVDCVAMFSGRLAEKPQSCLSWMAALDMLGLGLRARVEERTRLESALAAPRMDSRIQLDPPFDLQRFEDSGLGGRSTGRHVFALDPFLPSSSLSLAAPPWVPGFDGASGEGQSLGGIYEALE